VTAEGFPAITLWQPWASLVACGAKTWETRGWPTKYRGPLRIHAAAKIPADGLAVGGWSVYRQADAVRALDHVGEWHVLPLGAVVATADLVDCVPIVYAPDAAPDVSRLVVVDRSDTPPRCWDVRREGHGSTMSDTGQFPFGIWGPGRWAWRLEDIAPTTDRCPHCWGDGGFREDSRVLYGVSGGSDWADPCPTCNPGGRRTEPLGVGAYGCSPVPAKGGQRIWRWRP
jgi:activating signal cointegrator 1